MPNTKALVDTFEYILAHPKEWNQRKWVCGTAYCYAGTAAVHIFGAVLDRDECVTLTPELAGVLNQHEEDNELRAEGYSLARPWQEGDSMHIGDFAAVALGLTQDQYEDLFDPCNTLTDLKHMIETIVGIELPGV